MNPNPFDSLIHSRKFWLAVFAILQSILFQFVPNFPPTVWQSIDVLVLVLIAAIAHEDAAYNGANQTTNNYAAGGDLMTTTAVATNAPTVDGVAIEPIYVTGSTYIWDGKQFVAFPISPTILAHPPGVSG